MTRKCVGTVGDSFLRKTRTAAIAVFVHGRCTSLQVPSVSAATRAEFLSSRAAIALKSTALARILCPGARFGILFAANGYTANPNLL